MAGKSCKLANPLAVIHHELGQGNAKAIEENPWKAGSCDMDQQKLYCTRYTNGGTTGIHELFQAAANIQGYVLCIPGNLAT